MDQLDLKILQLLKENARMTIKDIASAVSLTSPAVSERVRRMEQQGVIMGYTVKVNRQVNPDKINAIISISVPVEDRDRFRELLSSVENIMRCYHVTGAHSHMIRVCCDDIAMLEHMLGLFQTVGQTSTQIILSDMDISDPYS